MATRMVVFDMDGTLVQTRAASWEVFQDTARRFALPVHSAEEFFELFRGNFYESLTTLCPDPQVEAAVREHFLTGLRERYAPRFIPGMRDVVKGLAAHYPLVVMSSNAMSAIRRILEAEGVAECIGHVFSGEIGSSKAEHLRRLQAEASYGNARHCSPSYVEGEPGDTAEVVLITDTVGDVREARSCGVRAIGVTWGMHSSAALLDAGAASVALWPQELLAELLPAGGADPACRCAGNGACDSGPAQQPARPVDRGWPWREVHAASARRRRHAAPQPAAAAARGGRAAPSDHVRRPDPALMAALQRISSSGDGRRTDRGSTDR